MKIRSWLPFIFINVGRVGAEVSDTEVADSHGTGHTQNHQVIPIRRAETRDLALSAAMKRAKMCGWPESPTPSGGRDNADESSTGKQAAVFFTGRSGNLLDGSVHLISTAQTQITP